VRVVNNIIHDTYGAGLGVNGGYNILLAYNTLYRVGARSHLLEFVFGLRTCDGDMSACAARLAAGGWGTTATGAEEPIPNRNIFVFNNLVVNPPGYQSQWQHFAIYGPRTPGASAHIPDPAVTDDNLVIAGNVIWNGPVDHPLGVGGADGGCADANSTCSAAQLEADNTINRILPQFADASSGDWQVTNAQAMPAPAAIPPFGVWDTFVPSVPPGAETNTVLFDFAGHSRSGRDVVGALVAGKTPAPLPPRVYVPFCRAAG
jgi:hypothetical protein